MRTTMDIDRKLRDDVVTLTGEKSKGKAVNNGEDVSNLRVLRRKLGNNR